MKIHKIFIFNLDNLLVIKLIISIKTICDWQMLVYCLFNHYIRSFLSQIRLNY